MYREAGMADRTRHHTADLQSQRSLSAQSKQQAREPRSRAPLFANCAPCSGKHAKMRVAQNHTLLVHNMMWFAGSCETCEDILQHSSKLYEAVMLPVTAEGYQIEDQQLLDQHSIYALLALQEDSTLKQLCLAHSHGSARHSNSCPALHGTPSLQDWHAAGRMYECRDPCLA